MANIKINNSNPPSSPSFVELVKRESLLARKKHGPVHSLHEGYGLLLEEIDELWEEIRKKPKNRNTKNLKNELVQIASLCLRMHDDL
jgi:NTP pyrophosphatase (non-canonical NTP hydrolase)